MTFTENLGLKKPSQNDIVNVDDLNYNADIIDEALARDTRWEDFVRSPLDTDILRALGG